MTFRHILARTIFWIHFAIVAFWIGLFFVPASAWAGKVGFHFLLSWGIVLHQIAWGAYVKRWTKRFEMVCILTTLTQWVRGDNLSVSRRYDYTFSRIFFEKLGWGVPQRGAAIPTFVILVAVTIQYFLFYS